MKILGVRYGHDSGAAIIIDGTIVANIAEERISRIKNDGSFPYKAINECLKIAGISAEEIDYLAIPGKEIPDAFFTFFTIPKSIKSKKNGNISTRISTKVKQSLYGGASGQHITLPLYKKPLSLSDSCKIHLCEHHRAHAASAYYTSGLSDRSLIVTMDGRGDNISAAVWKAENGKITELYKVNGGGSLGWFYSNITEAMGWQHGSGEWKVMGLAPYGEPVPDAFKGFYPEYKDGHLFRAHEFGNFGRWNENGANHYHGEDAAQLQKIIRQIGMENSAAETQRVVEEQAMNFIIPWLVKEKVKHLCCAGGFFLNVKFNQRLWYTGLLESQWIYPDCGDSGLAVGAALDALYNSEKSPVNIQRLEHLYLGPEYSNSDIETILKERGLSYYHTNEPDVVAADYLSKNYVIGWFQGRMEAGPRALGNRSILMSPLDSKNKDIINAKVKYRETFRPFCPSMLAEAKDKYLHNARDENFMVTSFDVLPEMIKHIPAVVHEDATARPQMVKKHVNPLYYNLIRKFAEITGEEVILNTSFNIRGEPIVCNPRDAIRCFFDTGLDVLVIGNYVIEKPILAKQHVEDHK